ncbi:hypothetical protein MCOR02_000219 [Pyricularia oryzae]|nr:hypothetical protein MCOR02_000219 [Pyricularia oryzae]
MGWDQRPGEQITRLKQKLAAAELPDELEDAGWDMGSPLADVKRLAKYWRDEFDWRQAEAELNQMPQFTTTMQIEGFDPIELHFVHAKSSRPNAVPSSSATGARFVRGGLQAAAAAGGRRRQRRQARV